MLRLPKTLLQLMFELLKRQKGIACQSTFLKLICSRKFVERELQQTHSDALIELYEAEKAGDWRLAQAIPWRLRVQLLAVAGSGLLGWLLSKMRLRIGGNGE